MLENNVRRQTTDDPEMLRLVSFMQILNGRILYDEQMYLKILVVFFRYLDDEQFAIMLQNREFMRRLKRSPDFMSILDRGMVVFYRFCYFVVLESPRKTHHKKQQHQHEERIPVPDGPIVG